jgi:hypothetical protein
MRLHAQGCRERTSWAEIALRRIAGFQSSDGVGASISPRTVSTMPSRMSSFLATWW